jgi:hypothetical protein
MPTDLAELEHAIEVNRTGVAIMRNLDPEMSRNVEVLLEVAESELARRKAASDPLASAKLHQAIELVFQCARPALSNPGFRDRLDRVLNAARESAGRDARIAELEAAIRLRAECRNCEPAGTVPTFLFDTEGGKYPTGDRKTCPACDGTKVHAWAHEVLVVHNSLAIANQGR